MPESLLQELLALAVIALALGMDAFSVGIGAGLQRMRWRHIATVSATVGVFHVIMPLIGAELGEHLHQSLGNVTNLLGALVLFGIGVQMIYHVFRKEDRYGPPLQSTGIGLVVYALSVSVDSLSAGFSLGVFDVDEWVAAAMFGVFGAVLSALGLAFGRKAGRHLGQYGEAVGGLVLIAFGFHYWMR
jgi:putative Mn2+ efflux pump MntP